MKNVIKKLSHSLFLLTLVWILNITLLYLSPGDATDRYWGPQTDRAILQSIKEARGLHLPYHRQVFLWTKRLLHGDLGYSWMHHRPVWDILIEAVPATLLLGAAALVITFFLGSIIGALSAIYAGKNLGRLLNYFSLAIYSTPVFCLAILGINVFSVQFNWLPGSGIQRLLFEPANHWEMFMDRLRHLILPASVLGVSGAAAIARYARAQMLVVSKQPYILMAQAKGLPAKAIWLKHTFRNASLPLITQFGLYVPVLLGGAFIIEVIFAWPGMGRVAYQAIFARDYPVLLAANFLTASMVVMGNLIADILYRIADPRVTRS